ncbi:MAG: hypothetical protein RL648_645 [Verrucomicrobiota bacterium]|jgi:hypothetical protein
MRLRLSYPILFATVGVLWGPTLATSAGNAPAALSNETLVFSEDFATATALSPAIWFLEGTGVAEVKDGKVQLQETPDGVGAVLWLRQDAPDNFVLRFKVSFNSNKGIGVLFMAARGRDGSDALEPAIPRTGAYDEYIRGDLDSYSLSFHRYWPDGRNNPGSNLRRNSGFHLLDQALPDPCLKSKIVYAFEIRKSGPTLTVHINGAMTHEATDPGTWGNPLGAGKIGFRIRGDASCVMTLEDMRLYALP